MSGISTHYSLTTRDHLYIDKAMLPIWIDTLTRKCSGSRLGTANSVLFRDQITEIQAKKVGWRKKLMSFKALFTAMAKIDGTPCTWVLKEYRVQRGRGYRHLDAFKSVAKNYRAFKYKGNNKTTYDPLLGATPAPPQRFTLGAAAPMVANNWIRDRFIAQVNEPDELQQAVERWDPELFTPNPPTAPPGANVPVRHGIGRRAPIRPGNLRRNRG